MFHVVNYIVKNENYCSIHKEESKSILYIYTLSWSTVKFCLQSQMKTQNDDAECKILYQHTRNARVKKQLQ